MNKIDPADAIQAIEEHIEDLSLSLAMCESRAADLTAENIKLKYQVDRHESEEAYASVLRINDNLSRKIKELEEKITSLAWSLDHVTELYHMEVAGEDW